VDLCGVWRFNFSRRKGSGAVNAMLTVILLLLTAPVSILGIGTAAMVARALFAGRTRELRA
jgi:multisubunit Na+/H+ antiporter MnhG subunit